MPNECQLIDEDVLDEGNNFVSFTKTLIMQLLGQDTDILAYLGYGSLMSTDSNTEDNDEEFDD